MLTVFIALSFAACMAGGLAPGLLRLSERLGASRLLAFRSGLLVAVALGDVLPEAARLSPHLAALAAAGALGLGAYLHGGDEHEGHEHTHPHIHPDAPPQNVASALAALFVHSFLDGVNLGSTALVGGPALLAVGAAVALHKLADGFTLTSLAGKRRRAWALLVLMSLATPFGAVFARAGELAIGPQLSALLLGFAGGSFLYVGGSQILVRLRARKDAPAAASFGAGAAAMLLLRRLAER